MRYLLAALYLLKFYIPFTQFILQNWALASFATSLGKLSPEVAAVAGTGLVVPLIASLAAIGLADLTIAAYTTLLGLLGVAIGKATQALAQQRTPQTKA